MIKSMTRSTVNNRIDYRSMLAGNAAYSPAAFELISSQILTSTAATITFSSITQTKYKHLQLRIAARGTFAGVNSDILLQMNGATGSVYSWHYLQSTGAATLGSGSAPTVTAISLPDTVTGSSATAGLFAAGIVDILDFTNTSKYKTLRSISSLHNGTTRRLQLVSGLYQATTAMSSISLSVASGGSFDIGSRFSIYGSVA